MTSASRGLVCLVGLGCSISAVTGQTLQGEKADGKSGKSPSEISERVPHVVLEAPSQTATLYGSGEQVETEWQEIWRPMCGSDPAAVSEGSLRAMALGHQMQMAAVGDDVLIVDNGGVRGAGINIVFALGASVPAAAVPAFAAAEAYLEAQFSDPITVTVSVTFASLGSGVLGGTSSSYTSATYANSRAGLVGGMDGSDTLQSFLPGGTVIKIRYNGNSSQITSEGTVYWTRASFNSTVGSVAGNAASMQFSNTFPFDYDPSNGVSGSAFSFQDVVIHEVGHSLGFTSGGDFRNSDIEALDLFRFQRTDGSADYNPDTTAEFTSQARMVSWNKPNDDHNSDLISVEYRMSDGSPYQMSHFREQSGASWIGLMDPALGYGETHYPNFFTAADLNMFDAIGYDR